VTLSSFRDHRESVDKAEFVALIWFPTQPMQYLLLDCKLYAIAYKTPIFITQETGMVI